jgi:hypothetical protein
MSGFLLGYDFYYTWVAGHLIKKGFNPYALELSQRELTAIGWPDTEQAVATSHPPLILWLYRIAAIAPFKIALGVWLLLSTAIPVFCSLKIAKAFYSSLHNKKQLLIFAAITFPPVVSNLLWGQVNALLLLSVCSFALLFYNNRNCMAGIILSIVFLKPHLFIPFLAIILFEEIAKRRFATVAGLCLGLILQLLASSLVCPGCIDMYLKHLPTMIGTHAVIRGATLGQMLQIEFGLHLVRPALLVIGILSGVFFTRRFGYSARTLLFLILPLSLIVSPYAWSHSMIVLLPAYLNIIDAVLQKITEQKLIYLMTLMAVLAIPLSLIAAVQYLWILLPIGILLLNYLVLTNSKNRDTVMNV